MHTGGGAPAGAQHLQPRRAGRVAGTFQRPTSRLTIRGRRYTLRDAVTLLLAPFIRQILSVPRSSVPEASKPANSRPSPRAISAGCLPAGRLHVESMERNRRARVARQAEHKTNEGTQRRPNRGGPAEAAQLPQARKDPVRDPASRLGPCRGIKPGTPCRVLVPKLARSVPNNAIRVI
jgi:hypothetical protein